MHEFLTLAITETDPVKKDFSVVAMEIKSKNITSFNLKKADIVSLQGEIFWDIGFTTLVKDVINPSSENRYRRTVAGVQLGQNKMHELKKILEAKSTNPKDFFENQNRDYGIVKVSKIQDIENRSDNINYKEEVQKHDLVVYISGMPDHLSPHRLLNKDYRWVKYWNYILNSNNYETKKKQYLKILNSKNKTMFLILHRRKFKNGSTNFWIAGIHWL